MASAEAFRLNADVTSFASTDSTNRSSLTRRIYCSKIEARTAERLSRKLYQLMEVVLQKEVHSKTCRMCGLATKLCKAHLFPRAFRKFLSTDPNDPHFFVVAVDGQQRDKKEYTLPFDPDILCSACDGYLGIFDNAFIRFLGAWQGDARRKRVSLLWPEQQVLNMEGDAAKVRLAILACLYRFALSDRYPSITIPAQRMDRLKAILLARDASAEEFPVILHGYYRCPIRIGESVIDVTETARPHPACSAEGFFFELFGTSIYINLEPHPKWPRLSVDYGGALVIALTGIERATPTYKHMYDHYLAGGGTIVQTTTGF